SWDLCHIKNIVVAAIVASAAPAARRTAGREAVRTGTGTDNAVRSAEGSARVLETAVADCGDGDSLPAPRPALVVDTGGVPPGAGGSSRTSPTKRNPLRGTVRIRR